jgi:hypothetical protein
MGNQDAAAALLYPQTSESQTLYENGECRMKNAERLDAHLHPLVCGSSHGGVL